MTKKIRYAGFGIFAACVLLLVGCNKKAESAGEKPLVVTTIGMIADAVENIAGDSVQLENLMGAGVDPHLYKATAGDVNKLNKADLILYSGLHLEAKMSDVLGKLSETRFVVAASESVPVKDRLDFEDSEFDPHVWFDVQLWLHSVQSVYESLCKLIPEKKDMFTENYTVYTNKLKDLDAYVRKQAATLPESKRVLVTAHDAFSYFSKAYGFEVRGLQGVSTVTEASTRDMQDLADFIATRKIPAIFIESSVPHKSVEALQAAVKSRGYDVAIGGELFSDAMGDAGTFEGTYIGMLTHNIDVIVSALSKN
ncbi:manganese transporter [Treponema phagedenis]|uniref:Manganese transporter n=1 Tax=Treponema phagedenis TaxID=162 RepID=A0A0B7GTA8_TREPH|nr:zinc ABC transporter substrate-binding protein [Treponema phagedenis]EFW36651.1 ABC transporter, substrate-binding protein [Treponema phagedenis F0421]NVP24824.1 zinc ABC transporter substrate-binding protein [Treponema phagedenis]QEJ94370.1 manganese transporter [Treponema phagedenis]QEJ98934.1 manganese transporter [Treponema phagedenis]QEK01713.1 manganese transporter [Treponema phagedenis]